MTRCVTCGVDHALGTPQDPEPLIDPDCRAGKHNACVGGPCECECHRG